MHWSMKLMWFGYGAVFGSFYGSIVTQIINHTTR